MTAALMMLLLAAGCAHRVPGAEAMRAACKDVGNWRSKPSQRPLTIVFVNRRAEPVTLDWIGFGGDRQRYATISPGSSVAQETFLWHRWTIAAEEGGCLGGFIARRSKDVVIE
jgi:hypothetical protein